MKGAQRKKVQSGSCYGKCNQKKFSSTTFAWSHLQKKYANDCVTPTPAPRKQGLGCYCWERKSPVNF